jgi:hypothetical protein
VSTKDPTTIGFNAYLEWAGINPADVWLARHQGPRFGKRRPYDLLLTDRKLLEEYQAQQDKLCFGDRPWLASFVATPVGKTLFVGVYAIKGWEPTKPGTIEPLSGQEASERWPYTHRLEPSPKLAAYHERLFIVWGHPRPWLQKADEHDKAVSELLAPWPDLTTKAPCA